MKLISFQILRFMVHDSKTNQSYNVHEIFLKDKRKNLRTKVELYIVENFSNKSKTLVKY